MVWLPAIVIFVYLAIVLYIGIFAFRRGKGTGEDFFLAGRSIGSIVFFLSLFATNMTAFAIIGSSGMSYRTGIGVFGMMATSSALVIPLTLFFIGTRLWALGKRFGHMTQVAYFRDRWECSEIGTFIFLLTAAMMLPYLIISIIGGGTILETLTEGHIPYAVGGAIVALVVMGNVFFGGMRGAVLVNVFQTLLFLSFGAIAFWAIGHRVSFPETVTKMLANPAQAPLLGRAAGPNGIPPGIPKLVFISYMLIPLSSIMFPHMSIMCLTAKKVQAFKKTVVLYPLCIMAIWLPCVFLGGLAAGLPPVSAAMAGESEALKAWAENQKPAKPPENFQLAVRLMDDLAKTHKGLELCNELIAKKEVPPPKEFSDKLVPIVGSLNGANATLAQKQLYPLVVRDVRALASSNSDSVLLMLLKLNVWPILAGILAAGIISAVMGSDCHQILALSTMFTKDIFDYYGGRRRFGERGTIFVGRTFIIVANLLAFLIALKRPQIFELAVQYAFSGFAALAPVMIAALFWKRSTKWGAFAAALFVAFCIAVTGILEIKFRQKVIPGPDVIILPNIYQWALFLNKQGQLRVFGMMPVVPIVAGSALLMYVVSLITPPPSQQTIDRYFPSKEAAAAPGMPVVA
ncbi:MAG TPA: sodium:solute symporter family protein [Humisphaera sp.]|nr:sodium:solute symporter family protein [Humisphaera sp.]